MKMNPHQAIAKNECIAAAYEGIAKDIEKLQQSMIKGDDVEKGIDQHIQLDDEIRSAFSKYLPGVRRQRKFLLSDSSYYEIEKRT